MVPGPQAQPVRAAKTFRAEARERLERFYTGGAVAAAGPNGGALLALACGEEAKVLDYSTGTVLKTLPGDSEPITALAMTPDGRHVFSSSRSLLSKKWCIETGTSLHSWKSHSAPVWDMAIDCSGGLLATASADRTLRVWDTGKCFCTHVFRGHKDIVLASAFHPDPHRLQLYSGGGDGEVRVWDLVNSSCLAVLKDHFSPVTSLSVSSCGWLLLSGGRDKMVNVWDLRINKKVTGVPVFEAVEGLVALPKGSDFPGAPPASSEQWQILKKKKHTFFCTAGEKGVVRVWNSMTGNFVASVSVSGGPARADEDGNATNSLTGLTLLPPDMGGGLLAATSEATLVDLRPEIDGVKDSANTGALVAARTLVGNIDEVTDLRLLALPGGEEDSSQAGTSQVSHIAVASNSSVINLFRASDRSCAASLQGHQEAVLCLDALHRKGLDGRRQVLLASGSKDNSICLWDCVSSGQLAVGKGHIGAVSAVAFAGSKAKFVVSAGVDKLIKVWDISKYTSEAGVNGMAKEGPEKLIATAAVAAHDKDINAVAVSPDDSLIVTGSADKTAKAWRMPNLLPVMTFKGHKRGVWSVAFSPVDKVVATASGDRTVKVWNLSDGSCLKTFEGHTASVLRCCFISAGTQIMTSGADGLLKLWSVRTSECVNTFDEHEDRVWALTPAPGDTSLLASGGSDAIVNIWRDSTEADEVAEAEEHQAALMKNQDLENALMYEEYDEAAKLAFQLKHPGKLLMVVNKILEDCGDSEGAAWQEQLERLVSSFETDEIKLALEYAQEWNTKARSCIAAQALVSAIVSSHPPAELVALPGAGELFEAMEEERSTPEEDPMDLMETPQNVSENSADENTEPAIGGSGKETGGSEDEGQEESPVTPAARPRAKGKAKAKDLAATTVKKAKRKKTGKEGATPGKETGGLRRKRAKSLA